MNKKTMTLYPVLKANLTLMGLDVNDVAKELDLAEITVREKTNGKSQLYLSEAKKIRNKWFPEMSIDELFAEADEIKKRPRRPEPTRA